MRKCSERDSEASEIGTRMALRVLVLGSVNRWRTSSWRGLQNYSAPITKSWATWYKSHILGEKVSLAWREFCVCTLPGVTKTSRGVVPLMPHKMWGWTFPRMKLGGITKLLGDGGYWAGENNMCLFLKYSFIGTA